jgi:hypothetical protein
LLTFTTSPGCSLFHDDDLGVRRPAIFGDLHPVDDEDLERLLGHLVLTGRAMYPQSRVSAFAAAGRVPAANGHLIAVRH